SLVAFKLKISANLLGCSTLNTGSIPQRDSSAFGTHKSAGSCAQHGPGCYTIGALTEGGSPVDPTSECLPIRKAGRVHRQRVFSAPAGRRRWSRWYGQN